MNRRTGGWIAITFIILLTGKAPAQQAVAPTTFYTTVAGSAAHLMPVHFKKILAQRQDHLYQGANAAYQPAVEGEDEALAERIDALVQRINKRLSENVPFNGLIVEYGQLVRLVAELEDPSRGRRATPWNTRLSKEFHRLLEKKCAQLPPVFYGFDAALFQKRDLKAFLTGIAERARLAGERLAATYVTDGRVKAFAEADERSPAFGIASLYYSHTISDVANLWLYIWWASYGDMRGTPFFDVTAKP